MMAVETIRVDPDDLAFELLPDIERSFGIALPQDLRDVATVGDLYRLILAQAPGASGSACGTLIAFHALRRALAALGVDPKAGPDLRLREAGLPSPRRVHRRLVGATALAVPAPPMTHARALCGLALLLVAPIGAWLLGHAWWSPVGPVLGWLMLRFGPGSWSGDWATLGALARATAARNHAALASRGARHSPQAVWNSLRTLLAGYGIGSRDVDAGTRLLA